MTLNEYQQAAARTIDPRHAHIELLFHSLHGMVSEIGELHGIYQKTYQGHEVEEAHLKKELGDLMWFAAEYCTAQGWNMDEIAQMNIDKLRMRYPDGFDSERSMHRKKGDV